MEIKIQQEVIEEAMQDAAHKAIKSAITGYEVQKAITNAVSVGVTSAVISESVGDAIKMIDKSAITLAIATQMQRTIVAGVAAVVEDAVVEIIAKMRGEYGDAAKARIRAELFSRSGNPQ